MTRFINPVPQYNANGAPLASGKLYFYESGTNTLMNIFEDSAESIQTNNPATLTVDGRVPDIFFSGLARVVLRDADGVQVWDKDNVSSDENFGQFSLYDATVTYQNNDIVFNSGGDFYKSIQNGNSNNTPSESPEFWESIDFLSQYNSNIEYGINKIVVESGKLYVSQLNSNIGNTPSADDGENWLDITNSLLSVYDNSLSGLLSNTVKLALDELKNLIDNLPSSVVYRGQLDVSAGDSALPASPQNGDLYIISVGGTITVSATGGTPAPTAVNPGDQIIYNGAETQWDVTSAATQASQVEYNNATSGLAANNAQDAIDEVVVDIALKANTADLGTAAFEDVQTSANDATTGAIMQLPANGRGSFGLGADNAQSDWPYTSLNECTGVGTGIYRATFGTTDTPDSSTGWVIDFSRRNTTTPQFSQLALRAGTLNGEVYHRSSNGGTEASPTWGDWKQIILQGDFGVGNTDEQPDWPNTSLNNLANIGTGTYRSVGATTDTPSSEEGVVYYARRGNATVEATQMYVVGDAGDIEMYIRRSSGGTDSNPTWGGWAKVWHGLNLVSPYSVANPNHTGDAIASTSVTLSRVAAVSEYFLTGTGTTTATLDTSGYEENDILVIHKQKQTGAVTVSVTGGSVTYPDGTTDSSISIPDTVALSFRCIVDASGDLFLSVQG